MEEIIELIKTGNAELLASKINQNPSLAEGKTEQGISLLQFAAYCRNMEAVRILREHKSHISVFEAVTLGESKTVEQLLNEKPERINHYSVDGFTLLGLAAFFGHLELAQGLLDKGADPNKAANNAFRVTPLHSACAMANLKMVELLLQKGADVNAKQMQEVTPMHSTAHNGQTALVQLLADNGADLNATMENGQTPLVMAEEGNFEETAGLIKKLGGV